MRRWILFLIIVISLGFGAVALAQVDTGEEAVQQTDDGNIIINTDEATEDLILFTTDAANALERALATFINSLYQLPSNDFVRVVLTVGGVILLFVGWRFYDWIIIIAGAMIGAATAASFVVGTNVFLELIAFVIGGFIGAFLGGVLWYLAVAVIGAYFGLMTAVYVVLAMGIGAPNSTYVLLLGAVLGIVLLLVLAFEFLVILGSILGAQLLVLGMVLDPASAWIIGLAITGILVQFFLTRRSGLSFRRRPSRRRIFGF